MRKRHILAAISVVAALMIPGKANGFNPPTGGDPWYYQSDLSLTFMVPDKAQHYWGSYAISSLLSKTNIGRVGGSIVALALGLAWEVKDAKTAANFMNPKAGVIGFSIRDLTADALGILSSQINTGDQVRMWLNYNTVQKEISINASVRW